MVSKVLVVAIAVGALAAVAAVVFYVQTASKPTVGRDPPLVEKTCKGSADCITGTVTRVVDGDTLDIDNIRIRLALVNTPEIDEAGYEESKQFTSDLCPVGSHAVADEDDGQTEGSFGRMLAKVTCEGGKVLNEELLEADMAEIFTDFCARSEFGDEDWAELHGCQPVADFFNSLDISIKHAYMVCI
ncbi:MAG TPA: thermonuclease family protein [Nitrososphaera sp.]|nr:thermonuclease family protein [Nitrososphaera sp.]